MAKYRLVVSFEFDEEEENIDGLIEDVGHNLSEAFADNEYYINRGKVALTRDGDRSGGNLLLPKLEGRVGQHLQTKKVNLKDFIK